MSSNNPLGDWSKISVATWLYVIAASNNNDNSRQSICSNILEYNSIYMATLTYDCFLCLTSNERLSIKMLSKTN